MALTTVITHATGDVLPASDWNTYLRDNLNWLIAAGANLNVVANVLTVTNEYHQVTGGGTVNTITTTSPVAGQMVTLLCAAATTFANGAGNVLTISGANRVTDVGEVVVLIYDGANWREAIPQSGLNAIYDNLLAANATSVATGTLPTNFTHLLIVTRTRTDSGTVYPTTDVLRMRLNGDAGTNYDSVGPDGTTDTGSTSMRIGASTMGTSGAGQFATTVIVILDYNSAANRKLVLSLPGGGFSTNNSPSAPVGLNQGQGTWRTSATPITALSFHTGPTVGTTNFVTGSRFTVYGLQ